VIFIFDIDDTILKSKKEECETCGYFKYTNPEPVIGWLDIANKLFSNGHIIILHTGRNWDQYQITKAQLEGIGLSYNELIMGKPQGFYIDATQNITKIKELQCYL